jgi:regulator of sigma E protease
LLIIAHEFGHFISAKLSGIKVEEFAFGFPPTIWKKKKGDTLYMINALPLGGYVKMLGEEENVKDPRSYSSQPARKKVLVVVAGVVMNLVLAWVLLSIGFAVGMAPLLSEPNQIDGTIIKSSVIVAEVVANSPADKSGLKVEDQIEYFLAADGTKTTVIAGQDLTNFTTSHKNQTISIVIKRAGVESTLTANLSNDETQPLGVSSINNTIVRVPWYHAPVAGAIETGKVFKLTFDFLVGFFKNLFVTGQVEKGVGGPVAIYVYTGLAVKMGFMAVLQFIAILSVNLALINILPLPALDGGKILFIILRRILGKHFIKEKIENYIHTGGLIALFILIALVTIKDIKNLF